MLVAFIWVVSAVADIQALRAATVMAITEGTEATVVAGAGAMVGVGLVYWPGTGR